MFKITGSLAVAAAVAMISSSNVHAAEQDCMTVEGVAMANFIPQEDGSSDIIASLQGSFTAASGSIISSTQTRTGFEMEIQHRFMTPAGGHLETRDSAVLTAIAGKEDRYMIEITYQVQQDASSGELEGYQGSFQSFGLVDLVGNQGLVRYSGEVCG